MKRGTIVLTSFPFSDLSTSKRRPAIVISKHNLEKKEIIVAYISSKIPDILSDTDFILKMNNKSFKKTGLLKESVFRMDKIVTITKKIIVGELGFADKNLMKELDKRLKLALDL
jgi:mRNA interferase MazF